MSDIQCLKDGQLYSYNYLKDNYPIIEILKQELLQEGYSYNGWIISDEITVEQDLSLNLGNMPENIYLTVWDYRNLIVISKEKRRTIFLSGKDIYENNLGKLVGDVYFMPFYDKPTESSRITLVNIINNGKETIDMDMPLPNDSYISGVVNDKIYVVDKTNILQYEINPKEKTVRIIGNKEINAQYYDGTKWKTRNIYDFVTNNLTFKTIKEVGELEKYNPKYIFETVSSYYFVSEDNTVYKSYKSDLTNTIILFKDDNATNFIFKENTLYYLSKDTIYYFDEVHGQKPIASKNEFLYNNKNIFDVYKNKKKMLFFLRFQCI